MNVRFYPGERRDFLAAWGLLSIAFTFVIVRVGPYTLIPRPTVSIPYLTAVFGATMATVGVGFLAHELAHKLVAVRFGQTAVFRADYTMLGLAVVGGLAGFLFAAPGAVHHRGRITPREHGLVAVAGPAINLALVALFLPFLLLGGFAGVTAQLGVTVNGLLAGFNMIPFGPLDGATVRKQWRTVEFAAAFLLCAGVAVATLLFVGFPF